MKITNIIKEFKALSRIKRIIICLFAASFIWVIASSVYSMIHQQLIETMTVGSEYTDVVYSDYGYIQVDEALITAEASGKVNILVEENERVPKNHEVFSVLASDSNSNNGSSKHHYAPISGLVSYHIDGYETVNDIEDIRKLDFREIYEKDVQDEKKKRHGSADSGKVYAKVVDNLGSAYLYMSYSPSKNPIFELEGDVFRIRFPELNESTTGTVKKIIDNGKNKKFCQISFGPVKESFLNHRVVQTEVYAIETATLELPKSAIVYQDGKAGVYTATDGFVQWKMVKVLEESKEKVECETLAEGTVIVLTPNRVSIGDVVKGS